MLMTFLCGMVTVVMIYYAKRIRKAPSSARLLPVHVTGISLSFLMALIFLFVVELFDLAHPGVQFPIEIRIVVTDIISVIAIASLIALLRYERIMS
jgi:hypothetical protein